MSNIIDIRERIKSNRKEKGICNYEDKSISELVEQFLEDSKGMDKEERYSYFMLKWIHRKKYILTEEVLVKIDNEIRKRLKMQVEEKKEIIENSIRIYAFKKQLKVKNTEQIISSLPRVEDMRMYKYKIDNKNVSRYKENMCCTYIKGEFRVEDVKQGGQVLLKGKSENSREYKLLLDYPMYKYLSPGDIIICKLSRKTFYVYWEIDSLYYVGK